MGLREKQLIHRIVNEDVPEAGARIGTAFNGPPMPFTIEEASLDGISEENLERFVSGSINRLVDLMTYFASRDDFTVRVVRAAIQGLHLRHVGDSKARGLRLEQGILTLQVNAHDPANGYLDENELLRQAEDLL
jgi:hypothetical protein